MTTNIDNIVEQLNNNNYKIVTLCGSTKFKTSFDKANLYLTLCNKIVLQPGCFAHANNIQITEDQKLALDKLHFEKIDMSDCIIVVNENNYIGTSTTNEINYAHNTNKPVYLMFN